MGQSYGPIIIGTSHSGPDTPQRREGQLVNDIILNTNIKEFSNYSKIHLGPFFILENLLQLPSMLMSIVQALRKLTSDTRNIFQEKFHKSAQDIVKSELVK